MLCIKCGQDKETKYFYRNKDGGFYSWCKECRVKHQKQVKESIAKQARKIEDKDVYPYWFSYNESVYQQNKKVMEEIK